MPFGRILTLAVTGTNGKTSTTSMLGSIAAAAGRVPAVVTTVGVSVGGESRGELPQDMKSFRAFVQSAEAEGADVLCLEVTSRALAGGFARRWAPDIATLTSFSRDHLDRHGTLEAYLAAKAQLFMALPPGGRAILPAHSEATALLREILDPSVDCRTFSVRAAKDCSPQRRRASGTRKLERRRRCSEPTAVRAPLGDFGAAADESAGADLWGQILDLNAAGTVIAMKGALQGIIALRMHGVPFVEDALAAGLTAQAAGISDDAIRRGLEGFAGVRGRFRLIGDGPRVAIDFAHTPDALRSALATARSLTPDGELILVFGCGGDRDTGKRPEMGCIASKYADSVILTSDNPRSEQPEEIARAIRSGIVGAAEWHEEPDRRKAIERALWRAKPRDVVLVAGKGHEAQQIVGSAIVPFDDEEVVRSALARRTSTNEPHRKGLAIREKSHEAS